MGVLDWHRHSELMSASYAWARARLAEIKAGGHPALSGTSD
jgi:hypothetical protein